MSLPIPRPGLVISYSYLWAREHQTGAEEGRKTRPCAIVIARQVIEAHEIVTVVPVTHTPPSDAADAIEIPAALKAHLGLDDQPSWIVVTETNDFLWPGPDLRPVPGTAPSRFDYGMLPPRFFAHVRDRLLQAYRNLTLIPYSVDRNPSRQAAWCIGWRAGQQSVRTPAAMYETGHIVKRVCG